MYKIKIKTPNYKLVGGDLSACEVRTCANASQDPDMLEAYKKGQDLYSVIASKIYDNKYEDNLEFYPEGTEILFEGKKIITGNEQVLYIKDNDREFKIPSYYLVETPKGMEKAINLKNGDNIITDEGEYDIKTIKNNNNIIIIRI